VRFRRKFRLTDVFLIDDIQFLAGKERIQEEFFHNPSTPCTRPTNQIVFTCDRPASEIQNLEQRLVRVLNGVWSRISQPPMPRPGLAILRKKKEKIMGVELPEKILVFSPTASARTSAGSKERWCAWLPTLR